MGKRISFFLWLHGTTMMRKFIIGLVSFVMLDARNLCCYVLTSGVAGFKSLNGSHRTGWGRKFH